MDGARCRCCDKRVYIGDEQESINLKLVKYGRAELGSCGKAICNYCAVYDHLTGRKRKMII